MGLPGVGAVCACNLHIGVCLRPSCNAWMCFCLCAAVTYIKATAAPRASLRAMAHVGAELQSMTRRLRALQRQMSRRSRAAVALEPSKPEEVVDGPVTVFLKVPPHARRVLAVFELTGRNATLAARFLAAQNGLDMREPTSLPQVLAAAVEHAYLKVPFQTIVGLFDPPTCPRQRRELFAAGCFVVQSQLCVWLLAQNKKGVAPGRRQLVAEACRLVPKELPREVATMLEKHWQGGGRTRSQRKWLRRFRLNFGFRLGRARAQAVMPLEEMRAKVGWPRIVTGQ